MRLLRVVTLGSVLGVASTGAAAQSVRVFENHARSVYKVEVLEERSSTPYTIGTAFVVDSEGRLLTNYHVVNDVVFSPESYHLRLVAFDNVQVDRVRIVGVDPVHDLAVLQADLAESRPLEFAREDPPVGQPVYSLGHPLDLTGTVVEGSFSGPLPNSLLGLLHFTGSLNPGMSGGPTLLETGEVVGVNVASSGNQLSYLVPIDRARDLLSGLASLPSDLVAQAQRSLTDLQARVRSVVFEEGLESTNIDAYEVPKPPGKLFQCGAAPIETDEIQYEGVLYSCTLDDGVWLDPDQDWPILWINHAVMSSDDLLGTQFGSIYSEWFTVVAEAVSESDWATEFRCDRRNVRNEGGTRLRAVQCWRRRPTFDGIYDLFLRTAVLGEGRTGVVSTYFMSGTSRENGEDLIRQALHTTRRIR